MQGTRPVEGESSWNEEFWSEGIALVADGRMAQPFFSIVIPNYNAVEHLSRCLASLKRQSYRNFETLVVDNGSNDESVEMVERGFPEVRLIRLPEPAGFARPVNEGIRQSAGRWIFTLNNDTEVDPRCLEEVWRGISAHPECAFFACKLLFHDRPEVINSAGHGLTRGLVVVDRGVGESAARYNQEAEVLGTCAGAGVYGRDLLEALGGFDEDFFMYYEDADLSVRAQLAGYRCRYLPGAIVYHVHSWSLGSASPLVHYLGYRNRLLLVLQSVPARFLLRHALGFTLSQFVTNAALAATGRAALAGRALAAALWLLPRTLWKRGNLRWQRAVDCSILERYFVN